MATPSITFKVNDAQTRLIPTQPTGNPTLDKGIALEKKSSWSPKSTLEIDGTTYIVNSASLKVFLGLNKTSILGNPKPSDLGSRLTQRALDLLSPLATAPTTTTPAEENTTARATESTTTTGTTRVEEEDDDPPFYDALERIPTLSTKTLATIATVAMAALALGTAWYFGAFSSPEVPKGPFTGWDNWAI